MSIQHASKVFEDFKNYLTKNDWKFSTDLSDGRFVILLSAKGEDLPMRLIIEIKEKKHLVSIWSLLPFEMGKERLLEGAVATSIINHYLECGSFDYNISTGQVLFRITTIVSEGEMGDFVYEAMIMTAFSTIDRYNDKLLVISKGMVGLDSMEEFLLKD